ncbi:MAG TPA: Wzz/FepE/Etk N-terminal domain-containing protein, partial [Gemmatimonadales bacterium]|nr:Wzz/FepE/Etk N-terminal domain-containing protein [Gemmatimonadales bacterium]
MTTPTPALTESVGFAEVYSTVRTHRKGIGVFVLGLTTLAAAGSFVLPTWYSAGAEFSIENTPTMNQPSGVLGLAAQLGLGMGSGNNTISYYADVLQSNQVLDQVALRRLPVDSTGRLRYLYSHTDTITTNRERDKARRKLVDHLNIAANARTNTITFSVDAPTPFAGRAAAETLLASLNRTIIALRRQRASAERAFLETRVENALHEQRVMEDSLRQFYVHNRMVNTPNLL